MYNLRKKKKKKCDYNIPYDEGLNSNSTQEYLKSLNVNIVTLENEINKDKKNHQKDIA